MTVASVRTTEASEEYSDIRLTVDTWKCAWCGGYTYDKSRYEVPRYCCRCGSRLIELKYKETKDA